MGPRHRTGAPDISPELNAERWEQLRASLRATRSSPAVLSALELSSPLLNLLAARALARVPLLRRLPLVRLVLIGELLVIAKQHFERLSVADRRRIVVLLRSVGGDPRRLAGAERAELAELLAKVEPAMFLETVVARLTRVGPQARSA